MHDGKIEQSAWNQISEPGQKICTFQPPNTSPAENMHDDKIERSAGVWTGLSQPVSSGRRPFYRSAVPAAVVQRNIWSGLLSWFLDEFQEHNR